MSTGGKSALWLLSEGKCCQRVEPSSDMTLVYLHIPRVGTLRGWLYTVYPKGASLRGATVYVARVNKRGELRLARPCENCWEELKSKGVSTVIYSTNYGWEQEWLT